MANGTATVRRFTICLATNDREAARVSAGAPGMLIPASAVCPGTALQALVDEATWFGMPVLPAGKRICPSLGPALAADAVLFGATEPTDDPAELAASMGELVELFPLVQQAHGPNGHLTSLVVQVPFADGAVGSTVVEAAHHLVKASVIEAGQLIGEFGRELLGGGTRFPEIQTRRSTVGEYLVLRTLLRGDRKYLGDDPAWVRPFEQRFGRGVDS